VRRVRACADARCADRNAGRNRDAYSDARTVTYTDADPDAYTGADYASAAC
jgi:hypothetical protein